MPAIWKRSKKNSGPKKRAKRERALTNLENKLKKGFKEIKNEQIALNDSDKNRIEKEIFILKERI